MKLYLDSTAWISIFNDQILFDKLVHSINTEKIKITFSYTNIYELVISEKIPVSKRNFNVTRLNHLGRSFEPDSVHIIGYTPLEQGRLADEIVREKFTLYVGDAIPENQFKDAIHALNAAYFNSILVTDDKRLKTFSQKIGAPQFDLEDLISFLYT